MFLSMVMRFRCCTASARLIQRTVAAQGESLAGLHALRRDAAGHGVPRTPIAGKHVE